MDETVYLADAEAGNMMVDCEILKIWESLPFEYQRQTFDSFMVGMRELHLPEREQLAFVKEAREYAGQIVWRSSDTIRRSFMDYATELLDYNGLSQEKMKAIRQKMYVRFLMGRIRFFEYQERLERCPDAPVPVGTADFHNVELAAVFARLPEQPEVKKCLGDMRIWWEDEQLDMVTWFASQLSIGYRDIFRPRPNYSARVTYQGLWKPRPMLWIAASLGEDLDEIRWVANLAEQRQTPREKCIVIRNWIPFSRIYELAKTMVELEKRAG